MGWGSGAVRDWSEVEWEDSAMAGTGHEAAGRTESRTVQLAELTPFEWDRVMVFGGSVSGATINEGVGQPIVDPSFRHLGDENTMGFLAGETAARAVIVDGSNIRPPTVVPATANPPAIPAALLP